MTVMEDSLRLLAEIERARLECVTFAELTGGSLVPEDPCVIACREADADLGKHDEEQGWSRDRTEDYRAPVPLGVPRPNPNLGPCADCGRRSRHATTCPRRRRI